MRLHPLLRCALRMCVFEHLGLVQVVAQEGGRSSVLMALTDHVMKLVPGWVSTALVDWQGRRQQLGRQMCAVLCAPATPSTVVFELALLLPCLGACKH